MRRHLEFPPSVPTSPAARLVVLVMLLAIGFLFSKKSFLHTPLCSPAISKKDEIKTLGDVRSELQKKTTSAHIKRKFLGQLYEQDSSEADLKTEHPLNS